MTENKQYILIPFEEGNLIFKDDGREFFNSVDCLKDNEIVDLLNEQDIQLIQFKSKNRELKEENKRLREIFIEQLETALTIPFIRKEYCNALLRILSEEDSLESAREHIKNFLGVDDD